MKRFLKNLFIQVLGSAWIFFALFCFFSPLVQQLNFSDEWKVASLLVAIVIPIILLLVLIGVGGGSGGGSGGSGGGGGCGGGCGGCGGGD